MAFDINEYFSSQGGNIEMTPESIREAAEALLSDAAEGMSNNTSYLAWAQDALTKLNEYDQYAAGQNPNNYVENGQPVPIEDTMERLLNEAYAWITGAQQPNAATNVWQGYQDNIEDIEQKLANAATNVANISDFTGNNPTTGEPWTEEDKQAYLESEAYQQNAEQLAEYTELAEKFGIDTSQATELVRTESGYIPASEVSTTAANTSTGNVGNLGEAVLVQQQTDGTWSIVGTSTGTVYQSGFADFATADATATFLQGGGSALNEITTSLPSNIDVSGLTAQQISDLEAIYAAVQSDTTLITDPTITSTTVTDAMITDYLATAQEELNPYYTQVFTRAGEELVRGLEYLTAQRKIELQTEQANALAEQQALLSGEAEKGTVFSGIRQEAEQQLLEAQEGAATSSQLAYEYNVETVGRQAEDYLGSEYLSTLELPELEGEPVFTPSGDVKGTLEAEQETAEQERATELETAAELAELAASDEEGVATDEIASLI